MGGTPNNQLITHCLSLYPKLRLLPPKILIETGTYYGKGATFFSNYFQKVHTIELSLKWYNETSKLLSTVESIECHFGNSVDVLPSLLINYNQRLAFYLDAHYSGLGTEKGKKEVPLLDELEIIGKRRDKDLIIIDDLRLFGSKGHCGVKDHKYYPIMEYDWTSITIESVLNTISSDEPPFFFTNDDRLIIIMNLSKEEKNLLQNK